MGQWGAIVPPDFERIENKREGEAWQKYTVDYCFPTPRCFDLPPLLLNSFLRNKIRQNCPLWSVFEDDDWKVQGRHGR